MGCKCNSCQNPFVLPIGPRGPRGLPGKSGVTGSNGADGVPGESVKGDQGNDGFDGSPGPQGIQGLPGPTGDQGIQGPAGADSVVPGPQGPQGIQGIQGVTGDNGRGYDATSATSSDILDTAATTVIGAVITTEKAYTPGARVRFSDTAAPQTNYFEGICTAYDPITGIMDVEYVDIKKGSTTITSWDVNLAGEQAETYDSGWVTVPFYDGGKGYGISNIGVAVSPKIRVINRTVYMEGIYMLPLDDGGGALVSDYATYPSTAQNGVYTGVDGGFDTTSTNIGQMVSKSPILPTTLWPNVAHAQPIGETAGIMLARRSIKLAGGVLKYPMISPFWQSPYMKTDGTLLFLNLKYIENDNVTGDYPFSTLRQIASSFGNGDFPISYGATYKNSYTVAVDNTLGTTTPAAAAFPAGLTFNPSIIEEHGGFVFPVSTNWNIDETTSINDIRDAINNL